MSLWTAKLEMVGTVVRMYGVTCSGCTLSVTTNSRRYGIGPAKTLGSAKSQFAKAGWKESIAEGWFCPDCVKTFEASGVRIRERRAASRLDK
jgi:hypothetical protein